MNDPDNEIRSLLGQHQFFSFGVTEQRARRLQNWILAMLAAAIVSCITAVAIDSGKIAPRVYSYYLPVGAFIGVAMCSFFIAIPIFLHRAGGYLEAPAKSLEKIKPMLSEYAPVRAQVREWSSMRPLQTRDVNFLNSIWPELDRRKELAAFNAFLSNSSQSPKSP